MRKIWENLDNCVYDWDELENELKYDEMAVVLCGQGERHTCKYVYLLVGVLEKKWDRGNGHYNWSMGKHFSFKPDHHYSGHCPEYTILPPQGEGYYCNVGFQSFTEFSYKELRKGLKILGYKDKALKHSEYAVRCVFGK